MYDYSLPAENALKHGLKMCTVLKSNLTLVFPLLKKMTELRRNELKNKLQTLVTNLQKEHEFEVQAYAPDKPIGKFIKPLYEKIEGIMIITGTYRNNFSCGLVIRNVLRQIRRSRIPWLFVPSAAPLNEYNHVILPVSYLRQTKEKIAWASYFHRLNQSAVHVLVANSKDKYIKQGIINNIEFLKKFFDKLNVFYKIIKTTKNIHQIDAYAIEYAAEHSAAPVVILVSSGYDIFDLLFGTDEKKIIMNNYNIPVLCINPLDDMYVVCS